MAHPLSADRVLSPTATEPKVSAHSGNAPLRYLSVCSGIEAATVAWHPLGWNPAAFSEIEAFPRAVLAHHYPQVPCHGDFTTIGADEYGPVDLLVGGTPCQSFSIAGLRGGLADGRGNLALEYLRLADRTRPRWLVWENVPGVLSSNEGRDFGSILGGLAELGYGFAYRILDAQHFGVPQRRRRVFVVGYLGDWRRAAAVLFERHSLQGDPAPRRETGQRVAGCLSPGAHPGGFNGQDAYNDQLIAHSLRGEGFDASEDGTGRGTPLVPVHAIQERAVSENADVGPQGKGWSADTAFTLEARNKVQAIAFSAKDHGADAMLDCSPTLRASGHSGSHANAGVMPAVAFMENVRAELRVSEATDALTRGGGKPGQGYAAAMVGSQVRRLTPREMRTPPRLPGRLHAGPIPQQARRRWSALQGARQQHGSSGDALDWRADRKGGRPRSYRKPRSMTDARFVGGAWFVYGREGVRGPFRSEPAQVDTHPKGGDANAAPSPMGSAVGLPMRPETHAKSLKTVPQLGGQG